MEARTESSCIIMQYSFLTLNQLFLENGSDLPSKKKIMYSERAKERLNELLSRFVLKVVFALFGPSTEGISLILGI